MKTPRYGLGLALLFAGASIAHAGEARLVRYPHVHENKVAFTYMGDIWSADLEGKNVQRLTSHHARDLTPRFSPDGKLVAFSSDREGNLDVWVVPAESGQPRQLTVHSSDDSVQGWTPDGKNVVFVSNRGDDFLGTLYLVPIDGGPETKAGTDYAMYGTVSPDGTKLAVNRKGQSYWRKMYRGSYQTDVTVVDLKDHSFKDVTDYNGMDTWPMWGNDGSIYFVSDRGDKPQANIWRVPSAGGEATRVTNFEDGDVRFPAISSDGKTIVFERDYRLWKLNLASGIAAAIPLEINVEPQDTLSEYRTVNNEADDYDAAPDGKQVIVATRGELFLVPTGEDGEIVQVTKGAARDRNVEYSPDGKLIAFVSDQESGREELYVVSADGSSDPKRLTDIDELKASYTWSPDSKSIVLTTPDGRLFRVPAEGGEAKLLYTNKFGSIGRPAWSPDGSLLTFSMPDVTRIDDIYIMPVEGGEPKKVTSDSASDRGPAFSSDGKKLYFTRTDFSDFSGGFGGERPQSTLMMVFLEKLDKDPDEVASDQTDTSPDAMMRRLGEQRKAASNGESTKKKVEAPNIDWAGLKRRTRPVLRAGAGRRGAGAPTGPMSVFTFVPGRDGKTLIFAGSSGTSGFGFGGGTSALYSCTDDGKNVRQIASTAPSPAAEGDGDAPRGRGGFGRGGFSNLKLTKDGRTVFYQEGSGVYSASLGGGGGGGGGGFAAMAAARGGSGSGRSGSPTGGSSEAASGGGGSGKRVNFTVGFEIDKPAEWKEMFGDAWRTMKYRFYDPKLHGIDWDAARAKYEPIVAHVADRQELINVINEMIGELNASHTGASAGRDQAASGDSAPRVQTQHLGVDLEPDKDAGRYKITHIYEEGPADKDWIKMSVGDYLMAIDGKPVKTSDSLYKLLTNRRLNRKVKLTLNSKPTDEGAWTVRYEPIPWSALSNLRYERWVNERRARVDELSGGRIGYLHIKAMDQTSLRRFEKDLREYRHKEAMIIDQRFNGGGNIEQELLAILVQKPYQVWQPRDTEATDRPNRGYFGPKVVLQNWRSASNAEMFPAGFRALGLGKLIGTPTMGAVIGTGSYSLIDGSTIRTPGVGVYLADPNHTNMENYGVQPDIFVENTPEDNLAGHDRQLETAVQELQKQLPAKPAEVAGAGTGGGDGSGK